MSQGVTLTSDARLTCRSLDDRADIAAITGLGLRTATVGAGLVALLAFVVAGWEAAVASLGAGVCLLACFSLQYVGFNALRRPGKWGVALSVGGLVVRLGGLGLLVWAQMRFAFVAPGVASTWVFVTGGTLVVAWLAGVFVSGLRTSHLADAQSYQPRADWGELA